MFFHCRAHVHLTPGILLSLPKSKNCCVFIFVESSLYIYRGSRSSSAVPVMLHCHVSTVTQNKQTKHGYEEGPLHF